MLRHCLVITLMILLSAPIASAQNTGPVARAMYAVRENDFDQAAREVRREGQVAADIVEWHRLRAGKGTAREAIGFLARRPDWPGLKYLRKQSEKSFVKASDARVLAFFAQQRAQSAEGALIHAAALRRDGNRKAAEAEIIHAWRSFAMGAGVQARYLKSYGKVLKKHHAARLDMALWKGWEKNANAMLPHVSKGWQALAKARLGLRDQVKGVDTLIEAVPGSLQKDPGLAYERFLWRARKGRTDSAIELMLAQSRAAALGEADRWAGRRASLARSDMRAKRYKRAYAIASSHGLSEGSKYSDLEWLSGYLALRFLKKPDLALAHFLRFEQSIYTPISLGRAGYWIGRAYEAKGDGEAAQRAYRAAGAHQTSFYGLLAAEKAGMPADPALSGKESFANWRKASWTGSSVHQAAMMLLQAGELTLAERFWVHLAESQEREALGQMGQMAIDLGSPHVAVMLGKRMVRQGVTLPAPYYPLHPLTRRKLPIPTEMALAIARRESEFDPVVISHAGARGLMQLMPGTARQVSAALEMKYSKSKLITDPNYNATLGSAYLAGLAEQFGGNVIMVAAGYNAGPGRPVRWMKDRGDPRRRGGMDIVDWIEHIPFNETRNYVMRVAESLPVYRARLGKKALPIPFSKELIGGTVPAIR